MDIFNSDSQRITINERYCFGTQKSDKTLSDNKKHYKQFLHVYGGIKNLYRYSKIYIGAFSYVQSFAGLFTAIAILRLNRIAVRDFAKDNSKNEFICTTLWLKFIFIFGVELCILKRLQFGIMKKIMER